MADTKHGWRGVYNGLEDHGMCSHCVCGWAGKGQRGGAQDELTMLAEYIDHRFDSAPAATIERHFYHNESRNP